MENNKLNRFKIIVAVDEDYGIGKNETIPWRNKEDLNNFRNITVEDKNNPVIMGRITYESLPKLLESDSGSK